MDNSDKHRSTDNIPIRVTVVSELEPTCGEGTYISDADGLFLNFSCGNDRYTVSHTPEKTVVTADGIINYSITLCAENTVAELATAFGTLAYTVRTLSRTCSQTASGVALDLDYALSAAGEAETVRHISVVADFISDKERNRK